MMKKILLLIFLFALSLQTVFAQDGIDFEQIRNHVREEQKNFELDYDEESEYWDYFIKVFLPNRLTGLNPPLKYREDVKIIVDQ